MRCFCFAIVLCVAQFAVADTNVSDLTPGKITGRLSQPLGRRIVIEGDSPEQVMVADNSLGVSAIDGKALKQRVYIEIRGKIRIEKRSHYRLEGYESGEFNGPPFWLDPDAQQNFQFYSFFVVTKVLEPKPK
ncbi:MAG: hypothetical protein WCJ09_25290 [Planctomycetota bacterium]